MIKVVGYKSEMANHLQALMNTSPQLVFSEQEKEE